MWVLLRAWAFRQESEGVVILGGLDVVIQINPWLASKGKPLKIRGARPGFIFVFHDDEDRLAWMDRIDEQIFDLNHPVREARPS